MNPDGRARSATPPSEEENPGVRRVRLAGRVYVPAPVYRAPANRVRAQPVAALGIPRIPDAPALAPPAPRNEVGAIPAAGNGPPAPDDDVVILWASIPVPGNEGPQVPQDHAPAPDASGIGNPRAQIPEIRNPQVAPPQHGVPVISMQSAPGVPVSGISNSQAPDIQNPAQARLAPPETRGARRRREEAEAESAEKEKNVEPEEREKAADPNIKRKRGRPKKGPM